MARHFTTCSDLAAILHRPDAPAIIDLRTPQDAAADPTRLPAARRLSLSDLEGGKGPKGPAVVYCQKGGKISQLGAALLRSRSVAASALADGYLAWVAGGHPLQALDGPGATWVMAMRPDWASLCALWVLRRLVDPEARVLGVAEDQIDAAARVWDARRLPAGPEGMAGAAALSHPAVARLARTDGAAILRGRLARTGDAETALDLVDDMLGGAA